MQYLLKISPENIGIIESLTKFAVSGLPSLSKRLSPSGALLRFFPSSFKRHNIVQTAALWRLYIIIRDNMKIYLNVRLNLENTGQTFTVWPRPHRFLPGLAFFTGSADCLSAAITDLMERLPETFHIDDEFSVSSSSLEPTILRPFEVVRSDVVRTFVLC